MMFLALREFKHAKLRFIMIGMILVLISWLVFICQVWVTVCLHLVLQTFKNMDATMWSLKKAIDIRCRGQLYRGFNCRA